LKKLAPDSVILRSTGTKSITALLSPKFLGCPSTLKNKDGKLARIIAKENEHKEAMKECKKAEKTEAKGRGSKPGTEPWAIRVRF
jgi:hypothetical protein